MNPTAPASAPASVPASAPAPRRRSCPHCQEQRIHRWGRFSGRQRYRCLSCQRTFSTYTGTALHYLKRTEAWNAFFRSMEESLTVRQAAAVSRVHRDTAFRWRHRFLAAVERGERVVLKGQASVGTTWFTRSHKGVKGGKGASAPDGARRVWVALARDENGLAISAVLGRRRPGAHVLVESLRERVAPDLMLRDRSGPYSPAGVCARRLGLPFSRLPSTSPASELEPVHLFAVRTKRWLRRFNGVATRYLSHYLTWFRIIDCRWSSSGWDLELIRPRAAGERTELVAPVA